MKKTIKIIGFGVVGLVCLLFLGFLFVYIYRKEILKEVNLKLKEEINGDIHIGDLRFTIFHNFPDVSLSLRDIYMRGPKYSEYHQDFLTAEIIDINVEGLKLFRKEVSIKSVDIINGEIFMFKTRSGYTNLDILKRTEKKRNTSESPSDQVNFRNINLENVAVAFHDSLKRKDFDVRFLKVRSTITPGDSSTLFHLLGQVKFIGLMFNADKGSYLKNTEAVTNFSLEFFPQTQQLVVKPSSIKLAKSEIRLSGFFNLKPSTFQLNIRADSLNYTEGLSVMPESLSTSLSKIEIEKKVNINVIVGGSLVPGSKAAVDLTFAGRGGKVSSDKFEMDPLTFRGSLTNHYDSMVDDDDRNILLSLDTLYGKLSGLPFGARAIVRDFESPQLNLNATFDIDLKVLNADTLSEINFKNGRFISSFSYDGPLEEYLDTKRKEYKGKLAGVVSLTDGEIEYVTKQLAFEQVKASIQFTNEECRIENISLIVNKNPVVITGLFTGFVPFFTQPDKRVKANLSVSSFKLDLAKLLVRKTTTKRSEASTLKNKRKISDLIDQLYKKLELEIAFNIKQFLNKDFKSENLTGKILLSNNKLQAKEVKMKFADGQIDFSVSLNQLQKKINPFTLTAKVKNADIQKFFYSFNNFGQAGIRHDNLSGQVNADVVLSAFINNDLDVLTSNLAGDVKFRVRDGRLIKFEPLEKVSTFLFRNRDLSNVQFGEIEGHFNMKGMELDVSRMEVQSTLMTLYLEGRYSLTDSTDLSIQVPLSNLKSRDQHIPPENIGTDKKAGASIFLRARKGEDGKTNITFDPFKKSKKKKK